MYLHTGWEQKKTRKWPIRWLPHYNKLHLVEDLMCGSSSVQWGASIYKRIFNIIKCFKVQFIVTKIAQKKLKLFKINIYTYASDYMENRILRYVFELTDLFPYKQN